MNVNETVPPPRQDSDLWGHRLFTQINLPADWCTVGQVAEHQEAGTLGSGGNPEYEIPDEEVAENYKDIPSNLKRIGS